MWNNMDQNNYEYGSFLRNVSLKEFSTKIKSWEPDKCDALRDLEPFVQF